MRIIAGKLKGREFKSPQAYTTHPMSDKLRAAIFNVLGDIEDLSLLDAFSGSGALSFEAVSRGASSAVAIEHKLAPYKVIKQNIQQLGLVDQVQAVNAEAGRWSGHNLAKKFNILLLDPPYDFIQLNSLPKLIRHAKTGGIIVLSWPSQEAVPKFEDCDLVSDKTYGNAKLVFYRKTK